MAHLKIEAAVKSDEAGSVGLTYRVPDPWYGLGNPKPYRDLFQSDSLDECEQFIRNYRAAEKQADEFNAARRDPPWWQRFFAHA